MSQVVDFFLEELALGWLKLQIMLSEALKHYGQVMEVFFFHFWKDNHVIQIDQAVS